MFSYERIIEVAEKTGCEIYKKEIMAKHTSFKIGGPADVFIKIKNKNGLSMCVRECTKNSIPFFVLGNGSNVLISDFGIRGAVFKLCGDFDNVFLKDETSIECGSSVTLSKLCNFALSNSLSGVEFAWGVPGSAGGAAFMNAGAYGGQMKDVLISCSHIDANGNFGTLSKEEMELGYRVSAYTKNRFIITSLLISLKKGDKSKIKLRMDELIKRRKDKQPLEMPSAGSVFKRPQGYYAGTLIQECGLKGKRIGNAMVSMKHGNFIVNCGGATCKDVIDLITFIQGKVFEEKKVVLECEVKTIGEV